MQGHSIFGMKRCVKDSLMAYCTILLDVTLMSYVSRCLAVGNHLFMKPYRYNPHTCKHTYIRIL
jgi:hypothetical protein